MIRHVTLLKFKDTFTSTERARWEAGLHTLVGRVPGLRSLDSGHDRLRSPRSFDYAIVADFDSIADVEAYAENPHHLELLAISGPRSEYIVSVDFEVAEPTTAGAETRPRLS